MKDLTIEALVEFEDQFYENPPIIPFYRALRYGQALCSVFDLPKEIEDRIYYKEDVGDCRGIIWEYATKLNKGE